MGDLSNCGCGCGSSIFGGNNCIFLILILLFCNNGSSGCGCGCGSGIFGGRNSCSTIIILILLFSCCGNGSSWMCDDHGCGCDRDRDNCGCGC